MGKIRQVYKCESWSKHNSCAISGLQTYPTSSRISWRQANFHAIINSLDEILLLSSFLEELDSCAQWPWWFCLQSKRTKFSIDLAQCDDVVVQTHTWKLGIDIISYFIFLLQNRECKDVIGDQHSTLQWVFAGVSFISPFWVQGMFNPLPLIPKPQLAMIFSQSSHKKTL